MIRTGESEREAGLPPDGREGCVYTARRLGWSEGWVG